MTKGKPRHPEPDRTPMLMALERAVETLSSTDDWILRDNGSTWAVLSYSQLSPGEERTVRMEIVREA